MNNYANQFLAQNIGSNGFCQMSPTVFFLGVKEEQANSEDDIILNLKHYQNISLRNLCHRIDFVQFLKAGK